MKLYEEPTIEVVEFSVVDVITSSNAEDQTPWN